MSRPKERVPFRASRRRPSATLLGMPSIGSENKFSSILENSRFEVENEELLKQFNTSSFSENVGELAESDEEEEETQTKESYQTLTCENCGKLFPSNERSSELMRGIFCSEACAQEAKLNKQAQDKFYRRNTIAPEGGLGGGGNNDFLFKANLIGRRSEQVKRENVERAAAPRKAMKVGKPILKCNSHTDLKNADPKNEVFRRRLAKVMPATSRSMPVKSVLSS